MDAINSYEPQVLETEIDGVRHWFKAINETSVIMVVNPDYLAKTRPCHPCEIPNSKLSATITRWLRGEEYKLELKYSRTPEQAWEW